VRRIDPLLILALIPFALAAAPKNEHVQATLLTDVSSIQPSQPFTAGVMMKIDPNWHVYWLNPGDSGEATNVKFEAPEGFKVEPTQYPVPVKFMQPGDMIGYGYTDQVMITAKITPPADVPAGSPVEITAKAKWLVCEDVCIPGKAELKANLPVNQTAAPANVEVFKKWAARMPVTRDKSDGAIANAGAMPPTSGNGPLELFAEWKDGQAPAKVEWFVAVPDGVMMKDAEDSTSGNRSTLRFTPFPAPKEPVKVPVIVAYTDAGGQRRGVTYEIQLAK
jgi:DsbC/DsbD-like thiol-disulfide interchange protein